MARMMEQFFAHQSGGSRISYSSSHGNCAALSLKVILYNLSPIYVEGPQFLSVCIILLTITLVNCASASLLCAAVATP